MNQKLIDTNIIILQMNLRTVKGVTGINCAGYFQNDWFCLDSLLDKQRNIYDFISEPRANNQDTTEMTEYYDVTEHIRVKLLQSTK